MRDNKRKETERVTEERIKEKAQNEKEKKTKITARPGEHEKAAQWRKLLSHSERHVQNKEADVRKSKEKTYTSIKY